MFNPVRVLIEKDALAYPMGKELEAVFRREGTEVILLDTTRTKGIPGTDKAKKYMDEREEVTVFEGAATSDPLPVEPYTHALAQTIEFFANEEKGRFRFVTKFNNIDSLLVLQHKGHTTIRFSINTDYVINSYEHLLKMLAKEIDESQHDRVAFEVISHRYTTKAKNRIMYIFPETTLPMEDEERKFKYGQFGYGKYVYDKNSLDAMKNFFQEKIKLYFPGSEIKYII